jgi:hypothetical protein
MWTLPRDSRPDSSHLPERVGEPLRQAAGHRRLQSIVKTHTPLGGSAVSANHYGYLQGKLTSWQQQVGEATPQVWDNDHDDAEQLRSVVVRDGQAPDDLEIAPLRGEPELDARGPAGAAGDAQQPEPNHGAACGREQITSAVF